MANANPRVAVMENRKGPMYSISKFPLLYVVVFISEAENITSFIFVKEKFVQ